MKKIAGTLLAGVMMLSTATPVAAATPERVRFMDALDATFAQLSVEHEIANRLNAESFQFMRELSQAPYEILVELALNANGQSTGIHQVTRTDEAAGRFSSSMSIFGLEVFLPAPDMMLNMYLNNNIMAFSDATVSDNFFYIPRNITPEQWSDTMLAEIGVNYLDILSALDVIESTLMMQAGSFSAMDFELPEGIADPYAQVIRNAVSNVRITSQGQHFVPAQRGNIVTERLTANLSTVAFGNMVRGLADTLRYDQELRNYIGGFAPLLGMDGPEAALVINMVIGGAVSALEELADAGLTASYSIYVASNGLAARQTLSIVIPAALTGDTPVTIVCTLDLLGRDFLVNELAFGIAAFDASDRVEFSFSQIGNNILRDGIMEGVMVMRGEISGQQLGNGYAEFSIDYFWDTNTDAGDFYYDMLFRLYAPALAALGMSEFEMDARWEGVSVIDLASGVYIIDSVITGGWAELLGDPDAYIVMISSIQTIAPDFVGIAGRGINLAELTEEDQELILEFMRILN